MAPTQMLKERASGMYRLSAFYFARTASDLPMDCTIPTVFIIIIYFMSGLKCATPLLCCRILALQIGMFTWFHSVS